MQSVPHPRERRDSTKVLLSKPPRGIEKGSIVVNDDDIWVSDGNIILSALSSSGSTLYLFKCHKSTLARWSPIFQAMLNLPQGPDEETFEGLPVVQLLDPPEDVQALLTLLYDPTFHPSSKRTRKEKQEAIMGPLRLAAKYEMTKLRSHLVSMLLMDWPTSLREWDDAQSIVQDGGGSHCLVHPVEVIQLGQTCDIPEILPASLYELNRGFNASPTTRRQGHPFIDIDSLTKSDLYHLFVGREKLADMTRKHFWSLRTKLQEPRTCACLRNRTDPYDRGMTCIPDECMVHPGFMGNLLSNGRDPLTDVKEALSHFTEECDRRDICNVCRRYVENSLRSLRQNIWDRLIECFDIEVI